MKKKMILCLTMLLVLSLTSCGCNAQQAPSESVSAPTWQEQYDLGIRYLSEGNYREAILAFEMAIEIDPKRPEAYAKAAETYEAMGDTDAARAIREKGYAETGDESLQPEAEPEISETEDTRDWALENFVTPYELTVNGVPFFQTDIYSAGAAYSVGDGTDPLRFHTHNDGDIVYSVMKETLLADGKRQGVDGLLYFIQSVDSNVLTQVTYGFDDTLPSVEYQYHPEFRDLIMGMSSKEALENLGFTELAIQYIEDSREQEGGVFGNVYTRELWDEQQAYAEYPGGDIPNIGWQFYSIDGSEEMEMRIIWRYETSEAIGVDQVRLLLQFRDGILHTIHLNCSISESEAEQSAESETGFVLPDLVGVVRTERVEFMDGYGTFEFDADRYLVREVFYYYDGYIECYEFEPATGDVRVTTYSLDGTILYENAYNDPESATRMLDDFDEFD